MIPIRIERLFWAVLLFMFGVLAGVLISFSDPLPADASCGSLPYIFVNASSVVDATTTNANNSFLLGCATQVDNTQIGAAGIFASQIIPNSTTTAKFSGSYGWTITVTASGQVPLTIQQPSSPTVDAFDIYNNALSTKYVWVDSSGVLNLNQAPKVNGTPLPSGATAPITLSGGSFGCATCVTGVTGTSPIVVSAGPTPAASCPTCVTNVTASGNLSSTGGTTPAITETANPSWTTGAANMFRATQGVTFGGANGFSFTGDGSYDTGLFSNGDGDLRLYSNASEIMGNGGSGVNVTFYGNVTATNFFTGSKRSYKTDIHPLHLDGLWLLEHTCWSRYHYKPKYGDPNVEHIGFVADCTPDVMAGPYHDHFDIEATTTVTAQAVLQLAHKIDGLERMVRGLCSLKQNRKVKACSSGR